MPDESILVINSGSSSLKFGIYKAVDGEVQLTLEGLADGIGKPTSKLEIKDAAGKTLHSEDTHFTSETDALTQATKHLKVTPTAIGHRVVHGGPNLTTHQRITPDLLKELKAAIHFAPLHVPLSIDLIESAQRTYRNISQFACFDTAFHTTIPELASRFPLPRKLFDEGIRRYGFHGLSYESIVHKLGDQLPARTVIAHLGSGASLAALRDGRSIDTTMGLTPTGGIPMATRSGDLDPGVLLYLMRVKKMDANALEKLLNQDSGLGAISGGTSDMRDLEASTDPNASLALEIFAMAIRKVIAAYAAELGGLDMLIFAGGIGEHSARLRKNVCEGLNFLGLTIDSSANQSNSETLSTPESKIRVNIIPAEEDIQIARHCYTLMRSPKP